MRTEDKQRDFWRACGEGLEDEVRARRETMRGPRARAVSVKFQGWRSDSRAARRFEGSRARGLSQERPPQFQLQSLPALRRMPQASLARTICIRGVEWAVGVGA